MSSLWEENLVTLKTRLTYKMGWERKMNRLGSTLMKVATAEDKLMLRLLI